MRKLASIVISIALTLSLIAPIAPVLALSTNLLANASVESATQATTPDGWTPSAWGTNTPTFTYATDGNTGSRSLSVSMASRTDGDAKWMHDAVTVTPNTSYTYSSNYKSTVDTEIDLKYTNASGATSYAYALYVPASATWKEVSTTFTTPSTATKLVVMHILAQSGTLQTDDFYLSTTAVAPPADASNLISNASFEVANGTIPAGWQRSGWGTNTANYTYESTGYTGSRSATVAMTSYTSGDAKWAADPSTVTPGATYMYSDFYKSTVDTRIVAAYSTAAGVYSYSELASAPASSTWNQYSAQLSVPATATKVSVYHLISAVGTLTIDDVKIAPSAPVATTIVPNGSLETASGATPANWQHNSWGTNTAAFAYATTGHAGSRSVKVTVSNYTDGDAKWHFTPATTLTPGKQYRFTSWYKTNAKAPKVIAMFTGQDGVARYAGLPNVMPPTGSTTTWQQYSDTFFVPAGTASVSVFMLLNENGWLQTDDYSISDYTPTGFNRPLLSLTFDDGHEDNVTTALPLLNQYGFKSTQCFATSFIQGNATAIANVKAFYAAGHEICSHTVTHPFLTKLGSTALRNELVNSQKYLQSIVGVPVRNFALPYGDYNTAVNTQIKKYYQSSRTVDAGYNSKDNFDAYRLRVQNVLVTTTPEQIRQWTVQAQADNTWLILVFHRVADNPGPYDTYTTVFAQQLEVVKSTGIAVKTYQDAFTEVKAQL